MIRRWESQVSPQSAQMALSEKCLKIERSSLCLSNRFLVRTIAQAAARNISRKTISTALVTIFPLFFFRAQFPSEGSPLILDGKISQGCHQDLRITYQGLWIFE